MWIISKWLKVDNDWLVKKNYNIRLLLVTDTNKISKKYMKIPEWYKCGRSVREHLCFSNLYLLNKEIDGQWTVK